VTLNLFRNRRLIIGTRHHKDQVLAPLLEANLGVHTEVPTEFDTDAWGTFSGEVERKLAPLDAAREKCLKALQETGCDLGVASEGSFGPHPQLIFSPANEEFLIFIDAKNNLEISAREISTQTNFKGAELKNKEALWAFADEALFPSHALILRKAKGAKELIIKGITDKITLEKSFEELKSLGGNVYAETDMRALYNPTRMAVIKAAGERLIAKISTVCPRCSRPGFAVTSLKKGLPCSLCGFPTESIRSQIHQCQGCHYEQEIEFPNQKHEEDPMFCPYCNP